MKTKWLRNGTRSFYSIIDYIAENNPAAAFRVSEKIRTAVAHLSIQPRMGRAGREEGTRELIITGTPYLIIYRIKENTVEILRVLHGAQRWPHP